MLRIDLMGGLTFNPKGVRVVTFSIQRGVGSQLVGGRVSNGGQVSICEGGCVNWVKKCQKMVIFDPPDGGSDGGQDPPQTPKSRRSEKPSEGVRDPPIHTKTHRDWGPAGQKVPKIGRHFLWNWQTPPLGSRRNTDRLKPAPLVRVGKK